MLVMKLPKLYAATTTALTLFAIGCLVILFVYVPMWQNSEPAFFINWFAANGKAIGMVMLPLEMAPLMLSLVTLVKFRKLNPQGDTFFLLANTCNFIILVLFLVYFLPANAAFMDKSLPLVEVKEALAEWEVYHVIRTALALLSAFFFGLAVYTNNCKVHMQ